MRPTLPGNLRLGGFLEISGLRTGELEGAYLGRARAVFLHRMGTLPVFGNTYYAGGSLEIGNVWQQRSDVSLGDTIKAGSLFFAVDDGHRLVGQTPLLLGIEACMGRLGGKYFHAVNVCISSVRRDKNL